MTIGILGAMPAEVELLCSKLTDCTAETYAGVTYHQGVLAGKKLVVCCAGMGKANAAATTQLLITRYGAEKIIFSGVAGNMSAQIGIGDVCVGKLVVYHDADTDCIVQSAPFLEEFPGDPALVQSALDACAACGVKAIAGRLQPATDLSATARPKRQLPRPATRTVLRWKGRPLPRLRPAIMCRA